MMSRRDVAVAALTVEYASNLGSTFLSDIGLDLPQPSIPGALPAMGLGWSNAQEQHRLLDLVTLWGIGDFDAKYACSTYYDPGSAWYNVMFGAYAIRSYKRDGKAWGYDCAGAAHFNEFLNEVAGVDYNFTTAGDLGCPADKMCFDVTQLDTHKEGAWDVAEVIATVPSGLRDPTKYHANPGSYLIWGSPPSDFLKGHDSFEPVVMAGKFYMRQWTPVASPVKQPITLVWGTACPNNADGQKLLEGIIDALGKLYLPIGG